MVVKLQDDLDKLETKYDNLFKQLPFMNVREKTTKKRNKKQQEEVKNLVLKDAGELVKKAIVKTVELKPEDIDAALIKKAAAEIKDENQ